MTTPRANALQFEVLERPREYNPLDFEDFIYNGVAASVEPVFEERRYASRFFYHKERRERNQLISVLLLMDDGIPSAVTKRSNLNPPDFDVVLAHGLSVFVEVTEGTTRYDSHLTNSIAYLRAAFGEWFLKSPAARAKAQGWNLAFNIDQPVPATQFEAALQEAQDFLLHESLTGVGPIMQPLILVEAG